jgi:hypothetical protein
MDQKSAQISLVVQINKMQLSLEIRVQHHIFFASVLNEGLCGSRLDNIEGTSRCSNIVDLEACTKFIIVRKDNDCIVSLYSVPPALSKFLKCL